VVGPSGPDEVSTQVHVHDISGYLLRSGIYVRQNVTGDAGTNTIANNRYTAV